MRVEQIPTRPSMGRSLIEHDPESRNFPARGTLFSTTLERRNKSWRRGYAYDQGQTSSCVGQTFKGVLNTSPFSSLVHYDTRTAYDAMEFYYGGQDNDQWPGREPSYYGTSALGVCKYLHQRGIISEYRWCFGIDDVIDTLVAHGPVGLGTWWWSGMWNTDESGYLRVTGDRVGGHEVELTGVDVRNQTVIGMNSWGRDWGVNGRFRITWDDLDRLLDDDGDAVTVVRL